MIYINLQVHNIFNNSMLRDDHCLVRLCGPEMLASSITSSSPSESSPKHSPYCWLWGSQSSSWFWRLYFAYWWLLRHVVTNHIRMPSIRRNPAKAIVASWLALGLMRWCSRPALSSGVSESRTALRFARSSGVCSCTPGGRAMASWTFLATAGSWPEPNQPIIAPLTFSST